MIGRSHRDEFALNGIERSHLGCPAHLGCGPWRTCSARDASEDDAQSCRGALDVASLGRQLGTDSKGLGLPFLPYVKSLEEATPCAADRCAPFFALVASR